MIVFVVYAPKSSYGYGELEASCTESEKFYREDHTFFKIIVGDFKAKIGHRRTAKEIHRGRSAIW